MGIGITSFLEDCRSRGLTKQTIATYRSNVGTYLDFVEDPLNARPNQDRHVQRRTPCPMDLPDIN